ncbi:MAG: efflux RND transporter periplasmic adaptor subunit [Calditrichaceae bacterium]
MKKYLIIGGIIIVVGALVAANLLRKEKGVEVTAEKISKGTILQKVTGSGQVKPAVDVKISANVAGKILELNAKEGERVKKGQLLVQLDRVQYEAAAERAESVLMSAQANEKIANSELVRAKELNAQRLSSQAEFESAEAKYEAAVSTRLQAEASLKEARESLSKTSLYASMDGVVTKMNKEVGEMAIGAQFQEDVILVVSNLAVMESVIEVDENEIINVSMNDTCDVEVDAFPDTLFKGFVSEIANSAITKGLGTQEQVTNFEVTVTILNADKRFRPGMSTTVDIYTDREDNIIKVPIQAVTVREKDRLEKKADVEDREDSEEDSEDETKKEMVEAVFVIQDSRAVAKAVRIGISDDTHYAILAGIDEGEEVITGPFKYLNKTLSTGDLVEIKSKKKGK